VTALASAVLSFLVFRVQRRNLLESVRPEIVLTGWGRRAEGPLEVVTVRSIRNVGRGTALRMLVQGGTEAMPGPLRAIPILAANETYELNLEVVLWWRDALDGRTLPLVVRVSCWDSRSICHETEYRLVVHHSSSNVLFADEIAPRVSFSGRSTRSTPMWRRGLAVRWRKAIRSVRTTASRLLAPLRRLTQGAADSKPPPGEG
jgi:hypothetical protein